MVGKTVTRENLYEAVRRKIGLSAYESKILVEQVLDQIAGCLARGEPVKLSGFGLFTVRQKRARLGAILRPASQRRSRLGGSFRSKRQRSLSSGSIPPSA